MKTDIIIIGAGASGLMAAYTLAKAGKTVTIVEARNRVGGRIHTVSENFSVPAELGAEFVHGDLPVTLNLLKEAGIGNSNVGFEMWQYHNDTFEQSEEFVEGWDNFLQKLNQLENDVPLHDFLNQNFAEKQYAKMRTQIENYVAGYDTADFRDASAFALRNEWNHEDEDAQHRVDGGYCTMINFLADACRNAGNQIYLTKVAREVIWKSNAVEVTTIDGSIYEADKIIIALPLGVLQAPDDEDGAIVFSPPIEEQKRAIHNMGFGSVIKILLEFDEIFWKNDVVGADLYNIGFLFSEEAIPTYWTQSPAQSPLLTGWLGGPPAYVQKETSDEAILEQAIESLSNIFKIETGKLKNKLVAWHVANWTAEPFTRGSYAYDKVESPQARKLLLYPVENTIYFAGEYLYDGPAMGTVEAALTSGKNVAEMILKGLICLIFVFSLISCKPDLSSCTEVTIENRWSEYNGGFEEFKVKDSSEVKFICDRISNFGEGKPVRIAYNYGYLEMYNGNVKLPEMIFTVRNGIVYRVGIGKYVYDDELTQRIVRLLKIDLEKWKEVDKAD